MCTTICTAARLRITRAVTPVLSNTSAITTQNGITVSTTASTKPVMYPLKVLCGASGRTSS